MARRLFIVTLTLAILHGLSRAATPLPSLVLTAKENGMENQPEFVCSGRVHGYLRLPSPAVGSHILEGIWTSPAGKVIAHSRNAVTFDPPGRSTAYLWLDFPERSAFSGLDPQGDQERLSYSGPWQVDVRWDDKSLIQSKFKVSCL